LPPFIAKMQQVMRRLFLGFVLIDVCSYINSLDVE
jgi:hypothetical protein